MSSLLPLCMIKARKIVSPHPTLNTALMSSQSAKTFAQAKNDRAYWGRLVESAVGASLLNGIRGTQIELFYWREVDFVLRRENETIAIEVKSNQEHFKKTGIDSFVLQFHPTKVLLIGPSGIALESFLSTPISDLFNN